jgi:hypothetical protein
MLERTMLPPHTTLKIEAAQPYTTPVPIYHINLHNVLKANTNMNILNQKKIAIKVIHRRVNSWRGVGILHFTNICRMLAFFSVSTGDPS